MIFYLMILMFPSGNGFAFQLIRYASLSVLKIIGKISKNQSMCPVPSAQCPNEQIWKSLLLSMKFMCYSLREYDWLDSR